MNLQETINKGLQQTLELKKKIDNYFLERYELVNITQSGCNVINGTAGEVTIF